MVDRLKKVQFEYLNYLFENMYMVRSKYYPESFFFKKNNKVVLELEKNGTLWVLYSNWTSIDNMLTLGYDGTQKLIKEWMEHKLKLGEIDPIRRPPFMSMESEIIELKPVEDTLLLGKTYLLNKVAQELDTIEIIPEKGFTRIHKNFEEDKESVKPVEITPLQGCVPPFLVDGEELTAQRMDYERRWDWKIINRSITPDIKGHSGSSWVESLLKSEEITPKQSVFPLEYPEEITPQESVPLQSWRDLENKEITPIKFYETESQVLEEQLTEEISKLSKDEKK